MSQVGDQRLALVLLLPAGVSPVGDSTLPFFGCAGIGSVGDDVAGQGYTSPGIIYAARQLDCGKD